MEDINYIALAIPEDVEYLRSLAHESEAHWGYDNRFMDVFDRKFNITETFILSNPVYVMKIKGIPVAFWGLTCDFDTWELEYFYVLERELGQGYGRIMWAHMINWCKAHKIKQIQFVTSDQAVGFYEKMGAVQEGMAKSMIDGRPIPHLVYSVNA